MYRVPLDKGVCNRQLLGGLWCCRSQPPTLTLVLALAVAVAGERVMPMLVSPTTWPGPLCEGEGQQGGRVPVKHQQQASVKHPGGVVWASHGGHDISVNNITCVWTTKEAHVWLASKPPLQACSTTQRHPSVCGWVNPGASLTG
jgi:hypothetical protein